jgi:hypothetical protein
MGWSTRIAETRRQEERLAQRHEREEPPPLASRAAVDEWRYGREEVQEAARVRQEIATRDRETPDRLPSAHQLAQRYWQATESWTVMEQKLAAGGDRVTKQSRERDGGYER